MDQNKQTSNFIVNTLWAVETHIAQCKINKIRNRHVWSINNERDAFQTRFQKHFNVNLCTEIFKNCNNLNTEVKYILNHRLYEIFEYISWEPVF